MAKSLEDRVAAIEELLNVDIRARNKTKREIKKIKKESKDPLVLENLKNYNTTEEPEF